MYAVIRADGRQQRVAPGQTIRLDKRQQANIGDPIQLDQILLLRNDENIVVGDPIVSGAMIEGRVVRNGRGKKIKVYTYKRRKGYERRKGHRQDFTEVRIDKISFDGVDYLPPEIKAAKPAQAASAPAEPEAAPTEGASGADSENASENENN